MNGNKVVARLSIERFREIIMVCGAIIFLQIPVTFAQDRKAVEPAIQQKILTLTETVGRLEAQMQDSQRELTELKQQLSALRDSTGVPDETSPSKPTDVSALAEAVAGIRDTQAAHDTELATLEQTKVESASKYPLRLSGMILMTGFVNTRRLDAAATPAVALAGGGSTGATIQQTVLGLDATGPHMFGASSHADLRFDFSGGAPAAGNSGGYKAALLRLRTAHAELNWERTQAFFSLDRPLLSPNTPTSLTAVALPALAWSGNLWAWNPQIGVSRDLVSSATGRFRAQAALTDLADPPPLFSVSQSTTYAPPASAEASRWPGVEARLAWEDQREDRGFTFGLSGLFAPHRTSLASRYDSWAGAVDFRLPITRFTQVTGSAYRGAALGSLGAGAYKNIVARTVQGELYLRTLDDIGGWVQWKQKAGERLEFNEALGIDNIPANQLRPYAITDPVNYYNLARNRTFTGNMIYSPSTYLLLSLEYRRIASSYVTSPSLYGDVIGIGAGYKF